MASPKEEIEALFGKWEALVTISLTVYEKLEGDVTEDNKTTIKEKMETFESNETRCRNLFEDIGNSDFAEKVGDLESWPEGWEETKDKGERLGITNPKTYQSN